MKRYELQPGNHNLSDEELVRSSQTGSQEAFVRLYERFFPKVYAWVRFKVPASDVDDVTQEVFIAMMKSLDSFRGQSKFSTWMWTLTSRKIADYHRQVRAKYAEQVELDEAIGYPSADDKDAMDHQDDVRIIQRALQALPQNYQDIIKMRFIENLPFQEIARHNGQTLEATKSLFRRSVAALTVQMEAANERT